MLNYIITTMAVLATGCVANAQAYWVSPSQGTSSSQTQQSSASSSSGQGSGAYFVNPSSSNQPSSQQAPAQQTGRAHWITPGQPALPQSSSAPAPHAYWLGGGQPASPQDGVVEPPPPTTVPVPVAKKQQKLEAQSGADCPTCRANEIERLAQVANQYAELSSQTLVNRGVQQVMNVTYQRCDADDPSMLVPPTYYNPAFHNADEADNIGHRYAGSSEMEPGDMPSYNDDDVNHREWMNYRIASRPGGMFYTKDHYGANCKKISDQPPIFCDGGRSQFNTLPTGQAYINVFNASNTPGRCHSPNFTTFDCSDLVSAVFVASGLRFYKTGPAAMPVTTATMSHFLHPGPNDCMGPAQFSGNKSLESGDVVLFNTHHSMVIDKVGADPFGLQKMDAATPCTQINPDNFDITIVQAGIFGGRMGPSRILYKDLLTTNGAIDETKAALKDFAIKACETARAGTTVKATVVSRDSDGDDNGATVLRPIGLRDPKCYVHKPATHPDCKPPTGSPTSDDCKRPWGAKMKGDECLQGCSFDDSGDGSAQ